MVEVIDFFPTKDTITIISHLDVDGVLCVSAINKMLKSTQKDPEAEDAKKLRIFFTSPTKVFNSLAKSIPDVNKLNVDDFSIGELFICDISLNRDTLMGSSIYDSVKWFDHHEVDSSEQYDSEIENIELILDPTANSATSIICDYYKIKDKLTTLADEIDTNEVKSKNGKRLRELFGALRLKYSGSKLKKVLYDLAIKLSKDMKVLNDEIYNPIIKDYKKWLDEFKQYSLEKAQPFTMNDHKIGLLETENVAPVYAIYEDLKKHPEGPFDIIAIMIHKYYRIGKDKNNKFKNKRYTKLEFRTHTEQDTLELAKIFGGGGHKLASGAIIMEGINQENLIKTLESHYSTS